MKKKLTSLLFFLLPLYLFCIDSEYLNILNFDSAQNRLDNSNTDISRIIIDSEQSFKIYLYGESFTTSLSNEFETLNQKDKYYLHIDETDYFAFKDNDFLYFFKGGILTLESKNSKKNRIINNIYSNSSDSEDFKVKISEDNYLYVFWNNQWFKCGYANLFNEDSSLVFDVISDNSFLFPNYMGFFSDDGKKLFLGSGDKFVDKSKCENLFNYKNPDVTRNSINIDNITFDLLLTDFLLKYPSSRLEKNGFGKDYIIDNFNDFNSITLHFAEDELIYFYLTLEEIDTHNTNSNIPVLVQKYLKELTEKYGIPEISEESYDRIYATKITRKYFWSGEICIELKYEYNYIPKYGIVAPICEILYTLDSFNVY